jgi:GMP synthase-like glutamine amidotransferase
MRIHVIQHVPFEGPGLIGEWAQECGHSLATSLAITEEYPDVDDIDFLAVMGGPMDADDEDASPWLVPEKHFIAEAIAAGRLVLGVCLGAQILAELIGGRVVRADEREIGWFPVRLTTDGAAEQLFARWPDEVVVGHWHGDTFKLPLGMEPALSSEITPNQAFVFDGRVVGVQFHLEWDEDALHALLEACSEELDDGGAHVATAEEFAADASKHVPECRELLFELLDGMEQTGPLRAGEGLR